MDESLQEALHCPGCSQHMHSMELQRRAVGKLSVDLCFDCCLLWLDHQESAQLAPSAVIELFQQIHAHRPARRVQVPRALSCPRCAGELVLTHDMCKSGPLQYYRCPADNGRLTPFFQFLREKQFLRSLTPAEMHRVRVEVKQIQCSNCGAPVDLEKSTSCPYCASPIAMIDTDAVRDALQMWSAQAERERTAQPQTNPRMQNPGNAEVAWMPSTSKSLPALDPITALTTGSDLVQTCIAALGELFISA